MIRDDQEGTPLGSIGGHLDAHEHTSPYIGDIVIRSNIVKADRDRCMGMIFRSSQMTSMMPSGKGGSKISLYTGCSQADSIKGMSLPFAVMIHLFKEALI
jgi:hypothetical protein